MQAIARLDPLVESCFNAVSRQTAIIQCGRSAAPRDSRFPEKAVTAIVPQLRRNDTLRSTIAGEPGMASKPALSRVTSALGAASHYSASEGQRSATGTLFAAPALTAEGLEWRPTLQSPDMSFDGFSDFGAQSSIHGSEALPAAPVTLAHGSGKDGVSSGGYKLYPDKIKIPKFPNINAWKTWKREFLDMLSLVAPRGDFLVNEWVESCFKPNVTPEMIEKNPFYACGGKSEHLGYLQLLSRLLKKPLMSIRGLPLRLQTLLRDMDNARREDPRQISEITSSQILVAFATYYKTGTEEYIQFVWTKLEKLELKTTGGLAIKRFVTTWQQCMDELGATEYEAHVVERACPWLEKQATKIPEIERLMSILALEDPETFRDRRRVHNKLMAWLTNADELIRKREDDEERKKNLESLAISINNPEEDLFAAPATPGGRPGDRSRDLDQKGKGKGKSEMTCFYHACKVLNNHPKWPLKGKGWSCSRGEKCLYEHGQVTLEEGLELIKKKAFPRNEHEEPRAPSAPRTGAPKGDGKNNDNGRGHSPKTPKHCKRFLRDGDCPGGKGCPGKKFHFTKEQLAEKMRGSEGGGEQRRADSPAPKPLVQ